MPGKRRLLPPQPRIVSVYAVVAGPRTWRALKLALDTGATYTLLPMDILGDVGYQPAAAARHLELATASGMILVPLIRVRSVRCLGITVNGLEVAAHHLPPESPVEPHGQSRWYPCPRPAWGPERYEASPGLYPRNRFAISGDDIPPTASLQHA